MTNISVLKISSRICSSSFSTRHHTFQSQFLLLMTLVILLVGLCPSVTSSPTPSATNEQNNKNNYDSNGYLLASNDDPSSSSTVPVHQKAISSSSPSSPYWYIQPRLHANQFLLSHFNENENLLPKWYKKPSFHDQINIDDDTDDYMPSTMFSHKRSTINGNQFAFSTMKKRKQLNKPPMEVMNEIVNSIYL